MQRLHLSGAIGCPAAYLFVLLRHKDRVKNPRGPDPASRLQNRAADPVLKPFKFLFAAYRPAQPTQHRGPQPGKASGAARRSEGARMGRAVGSWKGARAQPR